MPAAHGWLLPNGETAEQEGERETDLLLAWPREETSSLDEGALRSRWPEARRVQRLGKNLFLVAGVRGQEAGPQAEPTPGDPRQAAERLLAAARAAGDRRREVTALTDLGIVTLRECDARRALALHEEALALARGLGDRSAEGEVLANLGLAALAARQPRRALEHLEQAVAYAREAGDRLTEKAALDGLGQVYAGSRAPAKAVSFFGQALAVARDVGDRQHQATLLWQLAIQQAELGRRDAAVARGQEGVELLGAMGRPQAASFADALQRYRLDGAGLGPGDGWPAVPSDALFGGSAVPGDRPGPSAGGPGLLRMALSAAQALGKFVGSGLKAVTPETHRRRVRTCGACEHHTGLRCRVCGCFTNLKTRMAHEDCPIGKWPA